MNDLYTNENFPFPAVELLRQIGYDVLTTHEAGKANQAIPDDEVLDFSNHLGRVLVTLNRRDFIRLHNCGRIHAGIVVCKEDMDFSSMAQRIHSELMNNNPMNGKLLRVNRT